jgi:hypothetical protein
VAVVSWRQGENVRFGDGPEPTSPFQSELEAGLAAITATARLPDHSPARLFRFGTKQTNRQRDVRSAIDPSGQFVTYSHE